MSIYHFFLYNIIIYFKVRNFRVFFVFFAFLNSARKFKITKNTKVFSQIQKWEKLFKRESFLIKIYLILLSILKFFIFFSFSESFSAEYVPIHNQKFLLIPNFRPLFVFPLNCSFFLTQVLLRLLKFGDFS